VRHARPFIAAALAATAPSPASATDYGQAGALFPIAEQDLLAAIHARLVHLEQTGETARLNEDLKRRTVTKVNRPTAVAGLGLAQETRTWLFDPTVTLEADIADQQGRLIWPAGTRVNPLDTVPLRSVLLFFDGDDPVQLAWALERARKSAAKLILVNGAPLELMRAQQVRFYFDQGGTLVRHFAIRALPALVEQQGRALSVSELALPRNRKPQL
jgi:conjugal transfer pilus assembly protein TraW